MTLDHEGVTERVPVEGCVYVPPLINQPRKSTKSTADLTDKVTDGPHYTVDHIINHRVMDDGTTEFHVKWVHYEVPTWTAPTPIPEELFPRHVCSTTEFLVRIGIGVSIRVL